MSERMVRERERREITGLCRTTTYELEKRGTATRRVELTGGRVGWRHSELEAWIKNRRPVGEPRSWLTRYRPAGAARCASRSSTPSCACLAAVGSRGAEPMSRRGETAALARFQVERAWAEDVKNREEESLEVRLGELLNPEAVRGPPHGLTCAGSAPTWRPPYFASLRSASTRRPTGWGRRCADGARAPRPRSTSRSPSRGSAYR